MNDTRITTIDNHLLQEPLTGQQLSVLAPIAGIKLCDLHGRSKNLLIFPHCFRRQDKIEKECLFELVGGKLQTGNVMGFFEINGVSVRIHSRFDSDQNQYFLHYMLQKVFGLNLVSWKSQTSADELWEFLPYLFPYCLLRAVRQGIFKTYRQFFCNDEKVCGTLDIARHIKYNQPFAGRIAYRKRERSADNSLIQLIRHTLEYIETHKQHSHILKGYAEIQNAVSLIKAETPSYNKNERNKVVAANLRGVRHPYFTEYTVLQELCLKILRHEKNSYGEDKKEIHGIIFDGAWLWEEYLATLLKPAGFEHPENRTGKGIRYLYEKSQKGPFYPDFINCNTVMDAKYKKLDDNSIAREDRYQLISYMHVLQKTAGYFIYPSGKILMECACDGILKGYGGTVGMIPVKIPHEHQGWEDFKSQMQKNENILRKIIDKIQILDNAACE